MDEFATFAEFLQWIVGPAGAAAWALLWSDFLNGLKDTDKYEEGILDILSEFWVTVQPAVKQLISLVGTVAVPAIALLVLNYAPAVVERVNNIWPFLLSVLTAYFANNLGYKIFKDKN